MKGARLGVELDPEHVTRSLKRNLVWHPNGCATTSKKQLTVRPINGGSRAIAAARVSFAASHGWVTPTRWVHRTCDTPRCVNPDHLYIKSDSTETRPPVDLDQVAYLRSRGWTWQLIGEATKWTAQDVADIPHVRRIHEPLKADAISYIERLEQ